MADILRLPLELFLLIISLLAPSQLRAFRRTCRTVCQHSHSHFIQGSFELLHLKLTRQSLDHALRFAGLDGALAAVRRIEIVGSGILPADMVHLDIVARLVEIFKALPNMCNIRHNNLSPHQRSSTSALDIPRPDVGAGVILEAVIASNASGRISYMEFSNFIWGSTGDGLTPSWPKKDELIQGLLSGLSGITISLGNGSMTVVGSIRHAKGLGHLLHLALSGYALQSRQPPDLNIMFKPQCNQCGQALTWQHRHGRSILEHRKNRRVWEEVLRYTLRGVRNLRLIGMICGRGEILRIMSDVSQSIIRLDLQVSCIDRAV